VPKKPKEMIITTATNQRTFLAKPFLRMDFNIRFQGALFMNFREIIYGKGGFDKHFSCNSMGRKSRNAHNVRIGC